MRKLTKSWDILFPLFSITHIGVAKLWIWHYLRKLVFQSCQRFYKQFKPHDYAMSSHWCGAWLAARSPLWTHTSYHATFCDFTRYNWTCYLPEYQFFKTSLFAVEIFDSPSFEDSILQFKSLLHKSFLAAVKYCLRW